MKTLRSALDQLHISYTEDTIHKFEAYMEEILKWNKMVNLTAITDRESFIQKHYVDSLLCVPSTEFTQAKRVIDIGTGGGFPGIPLALAAPEKEFVLVDSLNKRIKIIQELCQKLNIPNVTAIHGRAEDLARKSDHRQHYDLCVSRAVANLSTLCEYCLPFVRRGGWFLAYKSAGTEQEQQEAKEAIRLLGGKLQRDEGAAIEQFDLPHRILFIEKKNNTPAKYPRKAGTPSKDPLK